MWEYICPKCRKTVKRNSHRCPHCGERFPLALRVPPSFLKNPKALEAYVHKHVFPRVSEFERNYLTKYFTEIFSDGFESGDFSAWTNTYGTPTIITSPVHHGTYAANFNANGEYIRKEIATTSPIYLRSYVRWDANPASSGQNVQLEGISIYTGTVCASLYLYNDGTDVVWRGHCRISASDNYYNSALQKNPSVNTWYCIEITVSTGNPAYWHFWVNGSELTDIAESGSQGYDMNYVLVGQKSSNYTVNIDVDCVVVADAYIGPEEEGTLVEVADSLELAETVLRNKTLILSDSLGLADSLYGNKSLLLRDSASLSELVTVIIGEVMKYVTDSVSSADLVSMPSRVLKALEAIGATDNAVVNKVLQITEAVGLAEIVEVGVGGVKKTRLFLILGDLAIQLTGD
jgi:DNA-directed RNA polymerase subunit RPC12/RpoP